MQVDTNLCWYQHPVTGPWRGSLGASLVSADSRVRVFWLSGLVDRPSERLYVHTYVILLCMGALKDAPFSSPLLLSHDWPHTGKPALYLPLLNNYPLTAVPVRYHQVPENFQTTELPGESPRLKQYPPRTGRLIT